MAGDSPAQPDRGSLAALVPGSRVAGYVIEGVIGWGGLGRVFRARDEALGRTLALKVIPRDPASQGGFAREAWVVAGLDHPNILPVYDVGVTDGYEYIAMRFVASGSLADIIRREGSLSAHRAMRYLAPVASALDAAHQAGLVHRDVKPANILVDSRPGRPEHVYLSDFGLAAHRPAGAGLTQTGTFFGTPGYASPEQIRDVDVDGRADQYALACLTDQMLTGSVPFMDDLPVVVLYAHLYQDPPLLTERRPDLPRAANEVLAKALAKAPDDRYESCDAFVAALRSALGTARRPRDAPEFSSSGPFSGPFPVTQASVLPPGSAGSGGSAGTPPSGSGNGGSPPQRYLRCRCQDVVPVGKPFSLLASVAVDGVSTARTAAPLPPFDGPADVTLVLHATPAGRTAGGRP